MICENLGYKHKKIIDICESMNEVIIKNDVEHRFSDKTINKIRQAIKYLIVAENMADEIDHLVSGNINERVFNSVWEDVFELI